MQRRIFSWQTTFLLLVLLLSVQACGSGNFKSVNDAQGHQLGVNQETSLFKGKLYFTMQRNLWVIDGARNATQLTHGIDVRDPAISPDGKKIAFVVRSKDYSDLVEMPTKGGSRQTLRSGHGQFQSAPNLPAPTNNFVWYMQPAWAPDNSHLLFLSDLKKQQMYAKTNIDAPMLDLQVYAIPVNHPAASPQDMAYANYGDGGNRDPSYRPHNAQQIAYTHYAYDGSGVKQVIQIFLEDTTAITNNPGKYGPNFDPGIALTAPGTENMQPAFSPDGKALAYVQRETSGQMGLYVMSAADGVTSNPNNPAIQQKALQPYKKASHLLSQQFVGQPVWSPDGQSLAYISYTNNSFDIWIAKVHVNPQSGGYTLQGNPIQLTSTSDGIDADSHPCWTL